MDYYNNHKLETLLKGLLILILLANCADAATLTVGPGETYTTIQSAINAASPGDTILVQSGTYNEHVVVNKQLTLRGVGSPVVNAGGSGDAITISANGCTLEGFVAKGSGAYPRAGIKATSSGNTLSGNIANGNSGAGILLDSSSRNTVSGNTANGNTDAGIHLYSSSGNTLSGNTATGNPFTGIYLQYSSGNTLSGNTATDSIDFGIFLDSSSNSNTLSGNTATGNRLSGISLYSSSSNTVSDNTVTGNSYGIRILLSSGNTVSGNTATGNRLTGIYLYSTSGNTLSGNTATGATGNPGIGNPGFGIYLESASDNTIYLNVLDNARSNGANHWNATTTQSYEKNGRILTGLLGNIWSDYNGFDCDGDGIGDTPNLIPEGSDKDYHPIGGEESSPGLEAQKSADRSEAYVGDWINYTIRVNNTGNVSLIGVRAEDNLTGAVWNVGTLLSGQNFTNTTRYQVLLSDPPGPLINELQANGTDPCGTEVKASAIETVQIQYNPQIEVKKYTNGQDANSAPGPYIPVNGIVTWTYNVTNTGNVNLTSVTLADNITGVVGTISLLLPGQSQTLTKTGTASVGQYSNMGNATGTTPTGSMVSDEDPSHYFGQSAGITLVKKTNGQDANSAPGPYIPVNGPVTWTYNVTNTGNVNLTSVTVADNITGVVGTISMLLPGQSQTLTATGTASAGQYSNMGNATGTTPTGSTVSDEDPSHYFGQVPSISLVKKTNGQDANSAPGPYILRNGTVTWTYNVTNTGNVNLTSVTVADNVTGVVGTMSMLLPGQSQTLTATGTASAGQYSNMGNATGTTPTGSMVSDEDPSHYFGQSAGITLIKKTNGQDANSAPGPYIPQNDTVTWTYNVTNTGNVNLTQVLVADNVTGVIGAIALFLPGQSQTLTATGTATAGQYSNMGNATGTTPTGSMVSDEDPSHYFGQVPSISLVKKTNGQDANSAPGPYIPQNGSVTWTYNVTNTGNVNLTQVLVADNVTGVIGAIALLLPGQSQTLTATGTATAGQYSNMGNATGTTPTGSMVSDEDPSHYFGQSAGITLIKKTNGQDANSAPGPYIPQNGSVTWTYNVTNTGNVNLTQVLVADNVTGVIGAIALLLPGQSQTLTATGTASVGQYSNMGNATGTTPTGSMVSDEDPSHYFGQSAGITLVKKTNGQDANSAPGPYIPQNGPVTWTYNVTNTGNVNLTQVLVADNVTGVVGTMPLLLPGQSQTLTAAGTASAGQYSNMGNATGTTPTGSMVSDEDPSHYLGQSAGITLVKKTNGQDANSAPGPYIPQNGPVTWSYQVNNTGNVNLSNVQVTDNITGVVGTMSLLLPGQSQTFTATGTASAGQYSNMGNATGTTPTGSMVSDEDPSHYFGQSTGISLVKKTNGQDANSAPGPYIPLNGPVTWTYNVTNTGNVNLTSVTVADNITGVVGTISLLLPGQSQTFTATGTASAGQYSNMGNATGTTPTGLKVSDEDPSHYFGQSTGISLVKKTNGQDANSAPGPFILQNDTVNWTYQVNNTGNVNLTNVEVKDNITGLIGTISLLLPGQSQTLTLTGTATAGQYSNLGNATGMTPTGSMVSDEDPSHYFGEAGEIDIETYTNGEDADFPPGPYIPEGEAVTWRYDVTTTSNVPIHNVFVTDSVSGVTPIYVSGDDNGDANLAANETWIYQATGTTVIGQYENVGKVMGVTLGNRALTDDDLSHYYGEVPKCLTLTKIADKPAAHRGEDINYTIKVCNDCPYEISFTNVTLWDVLPAGVELVYVYPEPASNLTWYIGTLASGQCYEVDLRVRVPIVDINYDMSQGVQGVGFVNVHNDYDTHQGPESVTNCAYAKADLVETLSSCASTRIVDPGTQLQKREFGSGAYESEELTRMRTENKSIRSISNLSAVHRPTSFSLPQNRSINYATKWTDKSKGINTITGASMNEEYTFASKIDNDRSIELDRNGSTMKTEVEFLGSGHIGVLKKQSPDAHPKSKPIFESGENFVGNFKVYEMVDEYGSSVRSNKSVTGYGYAAVDKRVQGSQRTYESGTGTYQSDEIIDTPSNYIAKDISLVRGPTSYNYTPRFGVSQNMLWSEGMWSRSGYLAGGDIFKDGSNCGLPVIKADNSSPPASYISERYSSLDYLKKDSVALGLNEMKTNASFSGMADFEVKSIGENQASKVDNEERYVGQYNIARKVLLTGVSKYDRPHITVQKVGNMTTQWFNKTNAQVAKYVITITNDGNVALAPINVRDIFPMGTEYIGSSIRPASLSRTDANWTLVHLGIGNTIKIELELNVTEYAPGNIVNRVMVCGMNGDACVSTAAYAALESAELPCCLPEVRLEKRAVLDATDATRVHFTIEVSNNAESTVAATLTDMLPAGLTYLSASPEPSRQEGQFLEWIVPDLQPDGVVVIEYQARATRDGSYVNSVHLDATAVDGTVYDTEDAAARVEVWSSGAAPKTTRYGGWQPPNWNMTSPDQGITIDLSPNEDLVE